MATSDWLPENSDWVSWQTPALPEPLTVGVEAVGTVTDAVAGMLGVVKTALQALSATQLVRLDLTQAAVSAAVAAVEAALKSLEGSAGIYLLLVPPRRKVIIPSVVRTAMERIGITSLPAGSVDLGVIQLHTSAAAQGLDPAASALLAESLSANSGGAGFVRSVVESLADEGDPSRPQLAHTDMLAGGIIVSGAADYSTLLSFLLAMDSFVGPGAAVSALNAPDIPCPKNLRVRKLVPGAQLTWEPLPAAVTVPALGSIFLISDVAIIRSRDPEILLARSPVDVFGTTRLTEGMVEGGAEVIKVQTYVVPFTTYIDTGIITSKTPYYYAVSYRLRDLKGNDLGYGPLSNAVKLLNTKQGASRNTESVPPDWIRTPRILDIVPGAATVFDWAKSAATTLKGTTLGTTASLESYIQFITQLSEYYGKYAETALSAVKKFSVLAATDLKAGAGFYSFSGTGGNSFLVKSVTTAASQLQFASTDFVGGVVILVAGPSPTVVKPVWDVLQTLLGTGTPEESIFAKALAGLGAEIEELRALTIASDFSTTGAAPVSTSAALSADCEPFEPTVPTIKDDFTV